MASALASTWHFPKRNYFSFFAGKRNKNTSKWKCTHIFVAAECSTVAFAFIVDLRTTSLISFRCQVWIFDDLISIIHFYFSSAYKIFSLSVCLFILSFTRGVRKLVSFSKIELKRLFSLLLDCIVCRRQAWKRPNEWQAASRNNSHETAITKLKNISLAHSDSSSAKFIPIHLPCDERYRRRHLFVTDIHPKRPFTNGMRLLFDFIYVSIKMPLMASSESRADRVWCLFAVFFFFFWWVQQPPWQRQSARRGRRIKMLMINSWGVADGVFRCAFSAAKQRRTTIRGIWFLFLFLAYFALMWNECHVINDHDRNLAPATVSCESRKPTEKYGLRWFCAPLSICKSQFMRLGNYARLIRRYEHIKYHNSSSTLFN